MDLFPEQIRDYAVSIVEGYINNKVPLSEGVMVKAAQFELNNEQIKRVVEATNQVAYLKLQSISPDRTFEFPLADTNEVNAMLVSPGVVKQASAARPSPLSIMSKGHEKTASAETTLENSLSCQDAKVLLTKHAFCLKGELGRIESEERMMLQKLASLSNSLNSDPLGLEKLASVANGNYHSLCQLMKGRVEEVEPGFFKQAELSTAVALCNEFTKALELVQEKAAVKEQIEKISSALEKEAFVGGLVRGALSGVGRVAGAVPRKAVAGAVSAGAGMLKGMKKATGRSSLPDLATATLEAKTTYTPSSNVWSSLHD